MTHISIVTELLREYSQGADERDIAEKIVHQLIPPGSILVSYHVARELYRDIQEGRITRALSTLEDIAEAGYRSTATPDPQPDGGA